MRQVELAGAGVWLSAPTVADVPEIAACCQEPGLAEMTSSIPIPCAESDARRFVVDSVEPEWAEGTALNWAIRLRRSGPVVGMVGLHGCGTYVPAGDGFVFDHAELGYWLAGQARSRGIMAEAARQVCGFAFAELGLRGVQWRALVGNVPSARVARRLGFRFTGVEEFEGWRGRAVDVWTAHVTVDGLRGSEDGALCEAWPHEVSMIT